MTVQASHLEAIGFYADNEDELHEWLKLALQESRVVEAGAWRYYLWSPGSGAELWIQADEDNTVVGFTPYFSGESRVRLALSQRVMEGDNLPLDGGFYGWIEGELDEDDGQIEATGLYPLIFEAPDYALHSGLELPALVDAQLTAFVHEAHVFATVEELRQGAGLPMPMADESFFPSGTFGMAEGKAQPSAFFTGRVTRVEQVINSLTGDDFYWVILRTYGGEIDAVIAPASVKRPPQPGDSIYCDACIFGKILP